MPINSNQFGHLPSGEDVETFEPAHTADKHAAPMGQTVSPEDMSRTLLALGRSKRIKPKDLLHPNTVELHPGAPKKG